MIALYMLSKIIVDECGASFMCSYDMLSGPGALFLLSFLKLCVNSVYVIGFASMCVS